MGFRFRGSRPSLRLLPNLAGRMLPWPRAARHHSYLRPSFFHFHTLPAFHVIGTFDQFLRHDPRRLREENSARWTMAAKAIDSSDW